MSQGTYYKVKPDGAKWKCSSCEEYFNSDEVIVFEHTETKKRSLLCLGCVDKDWLANAKCIGEL